MTPAERGRRIRHAREALEWRQIDLAVAVGVSKNTVGSWESGKSSPRNRIGRLEEVLGIDLSGGTFHPPTDPLDRAAVQVREALESLPPDAALPADLIDQLVDDYRRLATGSHHSPGDRQESRRMV